jgi:hypothetical protein
MTLQRSAKILPHFGGKLLQVAVADRKTGTGPRKSELRYASEVVAVVTAQRVQQSGREEWLASLKVTRAMARIV